ncbi:MAG: hypothetical protein GAK43_01987 [Stenotrophomonas maltophilia]|nr:MAG: hypothetical protein GAK43_01987 [Stenotrophomonas maltophilia]
MPAQRLTDLTAAELDAHVEAALQAQPAAIVQFSHSNRYDATLLRQLDALCQRHGERLNVRFYGHYPNDTFDGQVLLNLPHVQHLTLDCLEVTHNLHAVGELAQLRHFELQHLRGETPHLLALPNLRQLQRLRVSQDKGAPLDLAPIAEMPALQALAISVQAHNLAAVAGHPRLERLALHRMPASIGLAIVDTLPVLQHLSLAFGSRETMPELASPSLRSLEVVRVKGLTDVPLQGLPHLESLRAEDQAQVKALDLRNSPRLRALMLNNLTHLAALHGLRASSLDDLRLLRLPALDLAALATTELPATVRALQLWSGKRGLDRQLESLQQQLNIPAPPVPFGAGD